MRILLFAPAVSIHMRYWAEAFTARGHTLTFLTAHPPEDEAGFPAPLEVVRAPTGMAKSGYLRTVPRVRQVVRAFRPDVTIAYYATSYGFLAALAGVHPLVVATAGSDVLTPMFKPAPIGWLQRLAARRALTHADTVLAWSRHLATAAFGHGASPDRTVVQCRGIDLSRFAYREDGPAPGTGDRPLRIVSTRGLKPVYRLDRLIEAGAALVQRGHDVDLAVFGDGRSRAALTDLAERVGLDPARVLRGRAEPDVIARALREADLYVSLSESDGLSHSLLEAMACGAYPIVSDHPSYAEWLVDGETGRLLDSCAPLADAMIEVMADAAHRERAARANRARVERDGDILASIGRLEAILARTAGLVPNTRVSSAGDPSTGTGT